MWANVRALNVTIPVSVPCKNPYIFTCDQTFVHGRILNVMKSSANLNITNTTLDNSWNLNIILTQALILKHLLYIVYTATTEFLVVKFTIIKRGISIYTLF